VSRYHKDKTNLDFTEARDSEWKWHQLGHIQVCISLQTDNHASTPQLSFLQARFPSCCPTNSIKALNLSLQGGPKNSGYSVTADVLKLPEPICIIFGTLQCCFAVTTYANATLM